MPFHVQPLRSLDLPELAPYRTMRRQLEQRQEGIFVAEGEKVVRRLLQSNLTVASVLLPDKWFRELEPLLRARTDDMSVFVAEKELLETLTGFSMYQGLLAVGRVPPALDLDEVLDRSARPWLLAAVDGLSSAENLGAVVRNCAAFNVHALITDQTSASAFLRRAVRSSMGAVFELPILESKSLAARLGELRDRGVRCIAAHPRPGSCALPESDLRGDCCIIFGSEGSGISSEVLQRCDETAAIPMPPNVDSLNVGSAAAVFLYEANRQRGVKRER
ncbi:MAG: hypothetical protein C5B50_24680 [Verrucomicrobia bacterium]|nr:MAG: hypothetical protein C5B50_24680 [Verrucomicrobiota bacterium]